MVPGTKICILIFRRMLFLTRIWKLRTSILCRRESEAAVKRSDLANFDPDTPLEKLGWASEEMQGTSSSP